MHKITYTDDQLRRASGVIARALEKSLPDPSECVAPFDYSQDFLDKMDKLIRKARRRDMVRLVAQRVASVILAVLIGASAWLTVDTEARAAFVSWVREVYEDSFVYRYFGEKPEEGLQEYEITALPEGYELATTDCTHTMHIKLYQHEDSAIMLVYYQNHEGRSHIIEKRDEFDCEWKEVYVNGIVSDYYDLKDDALANELLWIDERDGMVFHLSAYLEESEMVRIAESIKIVE